MMSVGKRLKIYLTEVFELGSMLNLFGMTFVCAYLLTNLPIDLLKATTPASGGDMGSHFWPFYMLKNHGFSGVGVHLWNAGNLLGEPLLLHYFPLPFYLMLFFDLFLHENIAFNVVTILPAVALPISTYWSLKRFNCVEPAPLLGAIGSLFLLYNGTYSAWGGNFRSTLAGQFCHQYALLWIIPCLAQYSFEIRSKRHHVWSAVLAAATCLSHAYVTLSLPFALALICLTMPNRSWWFRVKSILSIGSVSLGLVAWWVVPMLSNNKWTTAYADDWLRHLSVPEYAPLWFVGMSFAVLTLFPVVFMSSKRFKFVGPSSRVAFIFFVLAILNLAMVFIFPHIGLVDIRAIPQVYYFSILSLSIVLASLLPFRKFPKASLLLVGIVLSGFLYWNVEERSNVKGMSNWAYGGWSTKELYPEVLGISELLKGTANDPRLVYEHDPQMVRAGTTRVFEMSPYFMGRSTLESLYLQATLLARPVYYVQALVSDKASCPIPGNPCPRPDLNRVQKYLDLMNVNHLILSSKLTIDQALKDESYQHLGDFKLWKVFEYKKQNSYIEPLVGVESIPFANWRVRFMEWLEKFEASSTVQITGKNAVEVSRRSLAEIEDLSECHAKTSIGVNQIGIETKCIGRPHLLKFSYHDSWKADDGSPIFLASPGMMVVFPKSEKTTLRFGQKKSWSVALYVSFLALFIGLLLVVRSIFRTKILPT